MGNSSNHRAIETYDSNKETAVKRWKYKLYKWGFCAAILASLGTAGYYHLKSEKMKQDFSQLRGVPTSVVRNYLEELKELKQKLGEFKRGSKEVKKQYSNQEEIKSIIESGEEGWTSCQNYLDKNYWPLVDKNKKLGEINEKLEKKVLDLNTENNKYLRDKHLIYDSEGKPWAERYAGKEGELKECLKAKEAVEETTKKEREVITVNKKGLNECGQSLNDCKLKLKKQDLCSRLNASLESNEEAQATEKIVLEYLKLFREETVYIPGSNTEEIKGGLYDQICSGEKGRENYSSNKMKFVQTPFAVVNIRLRELGD